MRKINTFDNFVLSGANKTRYIPIIGNSTGLIGAYRKIAATIETGQTPLFLLDGMLSANMLTKAKDKLGLAAFIVLYRSFDIKLKKRYEAELTRLRSSGYINKDGSFPEWALEDLHRFETTSDLFLKEQLTGILSPYFDYEKAKKEYIGAAKALPVDAATGEEIIGDINEYLFNRAKAMFPIGVESVLEANIKQSAILKTRFFIDGMRNEPVPNGVRRSGLNARQLSFCGTVEASIDDAISELCGFMRERLEQNGAVKLTDIITHCADIGLYKGNITLYAIGAACRGIKKETGIFYDGVAYWRYSEAQDISSWVLRVYDILQPRLIRGELRFLSRYESDSAIFYDNTSLKERIEYVFCVKPAQDKRLDTLGMAIVLITKWITENLRYPIDFLDNTLHRLFMERELFGEKLRRYDAYFTEERCAWLKDRIPHADSIARQVIKETVGFDPDAEKHGMSNLPKGHYAPVFYSAAEYIKNMRKEAVWV